MGAGAGASFGRGSRDPWSFSVGSGSRELHWEQRPGLEADLSPRIRVRVVTRPVGSGTTPRYGERGRGVHWSPVESELCSLDKASSRETLGKRLDCPASVC